MYRNSYSMSKEKGSVSTQIQPMTYDQEPKYQKNIIHQISLLINQFLIILKWFL